MRVINIIGLGQIQTWLRAHHVHGRILGMRQVHHWASDAEDSMLAGNPPMVEIRASESINGRAETFTVGDAGVSNA